MSTKEVSSKDIQKNKNGFYNKKDIEKLTPKEILELYIKETCPQDVLNVVRIQTTKKIKEKI